MSLPFVETQRAAEMTDFPESTVNSQDKADLLVNNLIYRQPKALSLAKSRTCTKQYFQRSDYLSATGKTAVCDWNTGSSYVDSANSFLVFTLVVNSTSTTGTFSFGNGSAMNLINRLQIRSRSGTELERVDEANLWSYYDLNYAQSPEYISTIGSMMGYGATSTDRLPYTFNSSIRFAIPLWFLAPLFRPLKKQLIPPQMAAGLHVELVFEAISTAFVTADSIDSYDITDIEFCTDIVELSDDTQRTLNLESAKNGLEWVSPRIYTSINAVPTGQSTVSIQVRKSVSQATSTICIPRSSSDITNLAADSFKSTYGALGNSLEWQFRVGALYFPNQIVRETGSTAHPETYLQALMTWDKNKLKWYPGSVSMRDFMVNLGLFSTNLSKNDDLLLSGLPLNNSRALELNLSFPGAPAFDRQFTLFLEYVQVAKFYSQNTSVAI